MFQERMRELSRTGFEIGASQDDARFAQEELRSRSLSAAGRPLKGLADLMERAGALYLELGPDDEGERLYREYGDALRRRVPADAAGRGEPDAALRAYARDLAFESVRASSSRAPTMHPAPASPSTTAPTPPGRRSSWTSSPTRA